MFGTRGQIVLSFILEFDKGKEISTKGSRPRHITVLWELRKGFEGGRC
jgi:hypothetical protein